MEQTTIGRYQLRQELAQGGTGVVYRAYDPLLKREVVLKVLWAHLFAGKPDLAQQFEREAEIIASLEHHSIIPLYDFGRDGEQRYFVRRFMKGGTLAARLTGVPLTLAETTGILVRVGGALQKAHSSGVTHRDLMPNNILFDEGGYAYLSDFGMIKTENLPEVTSDGVQTLGIPAYMSPEQLEGRTVDGRSDIYSLGIILYEMLAGRKPFDHSSVARLIVMQLTQPTPSLLQANPALSPGLEAVIQKAMAKEPESRYLSADEMVQAFHEAVDVPLAAVPHRSGITIPLPGKPAEEKARTRPQEAAAALAAMGNHVEAAEAWCEAEELEQAAGQYELAGRWSEAAALWLQLDRYDKRANAAYQYAQMLSEQAVGDEEKAIAWERAAGAFQEVGDKELQATSEREIARYRRQPLLILQIEPEVLSLNVWAKVNYTVRNQGFAAARFVHVGIIGDQFEGREVRTLTMRTVRPDGEFSYWLDVYPREQGSRVPLQLQIEYKDKNDQIHRLGRTFPVLVHKEPPAEDTPPATTPRPAAGTEGKSDLLKLRDQILQLFNESELHDLCWELNVDAERFDDTKPAFVRELISHMDRHGRLEELIQACRRARPHVTW